MIGTKYDFTLKIISELPCDVYISPKASSDPNEYNYGMAFKNVTQEMTLDSRRMPSISGYVVTQGFVINIYVHGIENKTNKLLNGVAGVSFTEHNPVVTEEKVKAKQFA